MSRPERSGGRVTATDIKNDRPRPPVSDEGGDRRQEGHHGAGGAASVVLRRGAGRAKAREPGRPSETRSHRERAKNRKPEGLGSQRVAPVCRRPGAPPDCGRTERPRVYAVAEPAARPRTGSPSEAKSAGTGQERSTECRRGGPVAAQRSSGLTRRQGGSPTGADGCGASGRRGGAKRSAARPRRTMAAAREGRGEGRGRRCTKPAGSDAAVRPRRLQRWPPTEQIFETSTQNQPSRLRTKHAAGK